MLWLLLAGTGFFVLSNYAHTRGRIGETPGRWPAGATIPLEKDRATLIMFAHPQCPCTRASIEELNRLLARSGTRVKAHVLFSTSSDYDWKSSGLRRSAAAIPGVTVSDDPGGKQATLFGAETSGHVVLFDPAGKRLFRGGITASRGHAGDNNGERAVISLLADEAAAVAQTPVFGCSLVSGDDSTSPNEFP